MVITFYWMLYTALQNKLHKIDHVNYRILVGIMKCLKILFFVYMIKPQSACSCRSIFQCLWYCYPFFAYFINCFKQNDIFLNFPLSLRSYFERIVMAIITNAWFVKCDGLPTFGGSGITSYCCLLYRMNALSVAWYLVLNFLANEAR